MALAQPVAGGEVVVGDAPGREHAVDLGDRRLELLNMLEDLVGDDQIEAPILERQPALLVDLADHLLPQQALQPLVVPVRAAVEDVGPAGLDAARAQQRDHLAGSAAEVEHAQPSVRPAMAQDVVDEPAAVHARGIELRVGHRAGTVTA